MSDYTKVEYPTLVLVMIDRHRGQEHRGMDMILYPEAAVRAGISLPRVSGKMECSNRSGYCSAIRLLVDPAHHETILTWAQSNPEVTRESEICYKVNNILG